MSDNNSTDHVDSMVRGLVDMMSDSGSTAMPMASTDATEVIKSQLTENTGRHLLDSGSHYGRNWEENQDNPPWEQPAWNVQGHDPEQGWVTHNVYDFMDRQFSRDSLAVALEVALYAFGTSGDRKRDSWLTTMKDFAGMMSEDRLRCDELEDMGIPEPAIDDVLGYNSELRAERSDGAAITHNTYNSECHSLSQCLQATSIGGLYAEYVLVQVHGGCDIRGGYTAPRVYNSRDHWTPMELEYHCHKCEWYNAESCVIRSDEVLHVEDADEPTIHDLVTEYAPDAYSDEEIRDHADYLIDQITDDERIDGAVLHKCQDGLGYCMAR